MTATAAARAAPRHLAKLPTLKGSSAQLATNCLLVGEGQRASIVWTTDAQFLALCDYFLNGNDQRDFVVGFRDDKGNPQYKRAFKSNACDHARWVHDTISGRASRPTTAAFYARNKQGQSRWGALDFDAHDGNRERPRAYALAAFNVILPLRELRIIVCTSGETGGWHVILFSENFHTVSDWERLLRQVATIIGAPVQPGVCEIMPRETRGRFGPALRPPGSWNPRDDSFGSIFFENVRSALPSPARSPLDLKRVTSFNLGKESSFHEGSENSECELGKEQASGEPGKEPPVFRGKNDAWRTRFAISAPSTRHNKLLLLVSEGFPQASRDVVRQNGALQYSEATSVPATSLEDHLLDFDEMWCGLWEQWLASVTEAECEKVSALRTETQRDAFRILRGWSRADQQDDFYAHALSLAERLGISLQGACELRKRFCALGILKKTQDYVPRQLAARYKWLI